MNNKEKLEILRRKLVELEGKSRKLSIDKNLIINLQSNAEQNLKLKNLLKDLELNEEIYALTDWTEYHREHITKLKNRIEVLEKRVSQEEFEEIRQEANLKNLIQEVRPEVEYKPHIIESSADKQKSDRIHEKLLETLEELTESEKICKAEQELDSEVKIPSAKKLDRDYETNRIEFENRSAVKGRILEQVEKRPEIRNDVGEQVKDLFEGNGIPKADRFKALRFGNIFENFARLNKSKIVRYGIPIMLLVLLASLIFVAKPDITGYVVLTQEKIYEDSLNLVVNQSENYTWTPENIGDIESIEASGRVKGNGTVKIYIEKDGKRYLIFDNQATNSNKTVKK